MSGWSSPITRPTSSGWVTSPGWKLSIRTTASRVAGVTVACSSSLPAMCSRKSSVDQSVRSDPTMVNPGGSSSASASWATAGSSRRLVRSPEAPNRTMRSIMW